MEVERVDLPGHTNIIPPCVGAAYIVAPSVKQVNIPMSGMFTHAASKPVSMKLGNRPEVSYLSQYTARNRSASWAAVPEFTR